MDTCATGGDNMPRPGTRIALGSTATKRAGDRRIPVRARDSRTWTRSNSDPNALARG